MVLNPSLKVLKLGPVHMQPDEAGGHPAAGVARRQRSLSQAKMRLALK